MYTLGVTLSINYLFFPECQFEKGPSCSFRIRSPSRFWNSKKGLMRVSSTIGEATKRTDTFSRIEIECAETCEDAFVSLAAYLRDMFEVELPPSYQTLQYQLCIQFAEEKLSTWITDRTDVFHSREGTPIGGCVANAVGGVSPQIIFYRHGDTAFLKNTTQCPDGTTPHFSGAIRAKNRKMGQRWNLTQDPLAKLEIYSPPLEPVACYVATMFIFNGLGVMEKPGDDTPPFDLLQKEMCDLFHRDSRSVEKTDIPTVATPDTRNLHTRRTGGTIPPVKKPDHDVDYRGGYRINPKITAHGIQKRDDRKKEDTDRKERLEREGETRQGKNRSEGLSSVDEVRQPSFRDTSDITTLVNTYGTKTCVVTPKGATVDDNEKLVLRFNEYQKSLKTESLQCPGKIRYELQKKGDFRRIMPDGSDHSITDFLDDFQAVKAESCDDAVKQLATYFRRAFTYDTLSSYQTLQYHLCVRYGGWKLRAWVKREGHMSLSSDNTPTPGCLLYKRGYMLHPITFYRHRETRTLRILSLPCRDGTVYKGDLDGVVHARNRSEGKEWDMAQDPLAEFSVLMPPLTDDRCRIAASFIFNGLGVMEKPNDDTLPFDLLQKEMCDLFHRDSRSVEKTDIPNVATPDPRNLYTRRRGGTIRPVKKPDDGVDYRGGYKVKVKASIHKGEEKRTDAPEAAKEVDAEKARGTQEEAATSRREDEPTRSPEASDRRGEDVVDAPRPSEESKHVLHATALSKTSEGSVEDATGQTSKTARRSKRWKSIRRMLKVLKPGKKPSYSLTVSSPQ
ncbi:hypothetical protein FOZ61_010090 [Perkinsus olseni]|uniref:Uncharacterized protein n=1 Tax=Perkinsus olseni TaxID=32597 RepID=A0A7J6M4R8_PEROL|nr:hypothetical protein FOZ61_010090 [Perkinsus olseni]